MKLVTQLKEETLAARKERSEDLVRYNLMTTLFGDVGTEAKNDGGREQTDADVEKIVRKFVKGANEMTKYGNAEQKAVAVRELEILSTYLPKQLSNEELARIMQEQIVATGNGAMGPVMKFLATNYKGLYDGAQAKSVFESLVTLNA